MSPRQHHGPMRGRRAGHRASGPALTLPSPWVRDAACGPADADALFFADPGAPDAAERHAQARAICAGCPVRTQCRAEADTVDQRHGRHGVWAGLTEADRTPPKPTRIRRAPAQPKLPRVADLSEAAFDADVLALADQHVPAAEIATRLNRALREVVLARDRAQIRRLRRHRRAQRAQQQRQVAA